MDLVQLLEMMGNTFYYGNEVSGGDFCDREHELSELADDVRSDLHVLLYAPRWIGKTSLLRKRQRELVQSDEYTVVFFDFFSVSSLDEFIQGYFNAVAKSFDTVPERVMNLLKFVLKMRPNVLLTGGQSGELIHGLSFSRTERAASLEDVLGLPHVYAQAKKKRVIVMFDEFQEIEQIDLEKKFRSIVQAHGRNICYLLGGSKKPSSTACFTTVRGPFTDCSGTSASARSPWAKGPPSSRPSLPGASRR